MPAQPEQLDVCAAQHATIMRRVNTVLSSDRRAQAEFKATMQQHLIDEPQWQTRIEGKVDKIALGLDAVMAIKVNGTEPLPGEFPLMTSLRGLHEVVRVEAIKIKFWKTFAEWRAQNKLFLILRTKVGRWGVAFILLVIINSVVQSLAGGEISAQSILKILKLIP